MHGLYTKIKINISYFNGFVHMTSEVWYLYAL